MQKKLLILAAAYTMAAAPQALAGQSETESQSADHAQTATPGGFELGIDAFDYSYREKLEGPDFVRDDGKFFGLNAAYVETLGGGWFLRAKAASAFGSVDYSSSDGDIDNVYQDVTQVEFHVGRDFLLGGDTTVTPFTGIGGRVLGDHSGGEETDTGFAGYDRRVGYTYIPVGLAAAVPLMGRSTLIFTGQYNIVVRGEAKSKFSEIDEEFPDLKLKLKGGSGIEAGAMVRMPNGSNTLSFGPFVRHWKIDQSESLVIEEDGERDEFVEPRNSSTEFGLRLTFGF